MARGRIMILRVAVQMDPFFERILQGDTVEKKS